MWRHELTALRGRADLRRFDRSFAETNVLRTRGLDILLLCAKPPGRVPAWVGRLATGEVGVAMMTQSRGSSNAKARRELGWEPAHPSWRSGFAETVAGTAHGVRSGR